MGITWAVLRPGNQGALAELEGAGGGHEPRRQPRQRDGRRARRLPQGLEDAARHPGGKQIDPDGAATLADAQATADKLLTKDGRKPVIGHEGPIIKEPTEIEMRFPPMCDNAEEYVVVGGYEKGGDNELFTIGKHKFFFRHSPHYVVVQLQHRIEAPEGFGQVARRCPRRRPHRARHFGDRVARSRLGALPAGDDRTQLAASSSPSRATRCTAATSRSWRRARLRLRRRRLRVSVVAEYLPLVTMFVLATVFAGAVVRRVADCSRRSGRRQPSPLRTSAGSCRAASRPSGSRCASTSWR